MNMFKRALILCLWVWMSVASATDTGWLVSPENDHAKVRIQADSSQPGKPRILLSVDLEKGWKTYWRSPGAGGVAPEISWDDKLPKIQWHWPVPSRFEVAGLSTQGYTGDVTFPLSFKGEIPNGRIQGTLTLPTCSNVCILTDYPIDINLNNPGDSGQFSQDYTKAMTLLPQKQGLVDHLELGYRPGFLQVKATRSQGWKQPGIFIDVVDGAVFDEPQINIDGTTLFAEIPVTDDFGDKAPDLVGKNITVVIKNAGIGEELTAQTSTAFPPLNAGDNYPFWQILLMAILGGLILNLMPCVLPVLGLKLGSVLQVNQQEKRSIRLQFIASSLGIIVSFMALALLMTILRLTGNALGWGIQFQNPWFIGFLGAVMALFTANLFGLFSINLSSNVTTRLATTGQGKITGSFFQGAFATLLATPCSAPFLGVAVAFAFAAPLPVLWAIFIALGLGMSLPWLLVSLVPKIVLCLPKPGNWMNKLRVFLGFMMLASTFWIFSLLDQHVGYQIVLGLIALFIAALIIGVFIRYGRKIGIQVSLITSIFLAIAIGASLYISHTLSNGKLDHIKWLPLTEQAIQNALAENKVVFIDVTADWCITCKANKYNVLLRENIQDALNEQDVIALRGDWTLRSRSITDFLNSRGRSAVPFNQIYGPGLPQGKILPVLLTQQSVMDALNEARENTK